MRARAAYGGHDKIAGPEVLDGGSSAYDLGH